MVGRLRSKCHRLLGLICCLGLSGAVLSSEVGRGEIEIPRLVSIDGAITEIIYALGGDSRLVGVDTTSRYPVAATTLPSVGYMRNLSPEGVLSLSPSGVIVSSDAGPEAVLQHIAHAGVPVHRIPSEHSVAGVLKKVHGVASVLGKSSEGEALASAIQQAVMSIRRQVPSLEEQAAPTVLLLLSAGGRGLLMAGEHTQGDALIGVLGGKNVATGFTSYKPLTPEGALNLAPDVLVVAETGKGAFHLESYPFLAHTPAVQQGRWVVADSMLLLGFGPRLPEALELLLPVLYPEPEPEPEPAPAGAVALAP